MNNQTPYIEYNGEVYEFEASFELKRIYDREVKKEYQNQLLKNIKTEEEAKELQELMEYIQKHPDLKEENIDNKMREKLMKYRELTLNISLIKAYDKLCYLMLKEKYSITEKQYQSMLEGLAKDYGISFIDVFVQKVCEKVFMPKEEKKEEKKPLPSWID